MTDTVSNAMAVSPVVPRVPVVSDESAMRDWAAELGPLQMTRTPRPPR
jgi:hypothetical protein